jgi:hypothetical protein
MTVSSDRYFRTLKTLDTFVDRSLELPYKEPTLSGFHYNRDLLKSAVAKTYLETVGNRADSIHLAVKQVPISNIVREFQNTVEHLGTRFNLKKKMLFLLLITQMRISMATRRECTSTVLPACMV